MINTGEVMIGKLNLTEPKLIVIWGRKFTRKQLDDLVESLRTPTFDEMVKAWSKVCDYNVVHEDGYVIVGDCVVGGYIFASINIEKGVFDLPDYYNSDLHNAINLTIRYLEGKKEKENGK